MQREKLGETGLQVNEQVREEDSGISVKGRIGVDNEINHKKRKQKRPVINKKEEKIEHVN